MSVSDIVKNMINASMGPLKDSIKNELLTRFPQLNELKSLSETVKGFPALLPIAKEAVVSEVNKVMDFQLGQYDKKVGDLIDKKVAAATAAGLATAGVAAGVAAATENTGEYENNAGAYENNAGAYENNAGAYENNAGAYENNAGAYENNAGATEENYQEGGRRPRQTRRRVPRRPRRSNRKISRKGIRKMNGKRGASRRAPATRRNRRAASRRAASRRASTRRNRRSNRK